MSPQIPRLSNARPLRPRGSTPNPGNEALKAFKSPRPSLRQSRRSATAKAIGWTAGVPGEPKTGLRGPAIDRQLDYWRKHLASVPVLELPTDSPRQARKAHARACHSFVLPGGLSDKLDAFNYSSNVTPFMSLLGAFQVLLARYSGQRDILVGTPIATRQRRERDDLSGAFTNTLVMRTDLSGDLGFREVVALARKTALGAYKHQDLPFERLVEELKPTGDPSRHPFCRVLFAVQNAPSSPLQLEGLEVSTPALPTAVIRYDLELHLQAVGKTWGGFIYYSTELFEKETIVRLAGHYLTLLDSMLADPDRPVWNVAMLTPAEREQILMKWNNTEADYPRDKCVHELFEEQARKTPEAVAVVFGGGQLSYRRLNECADALAARLSELGVGADVLVGICAQRSAEMIVGILAILKAGGAYVPIDPAQPAERIAFLLEDAAPHVLLAQRSFMGALPPTNSKVVALEMDLPAAETRVQTQKPGPDNLAYVMFTSGSTGRPKGVCVPHRGIARLVKNTNYARFGPGETLLQLAAQAFDASTFEIWGALLHGARLVVPPPRQPSLSELGEMVKKNEITTVFITSALFHQMVEEQLDDLKGLRQLLTGGEVVSTAHLRKALRGLPGCQIIHVYGPTENTTFTSHIPIGDAEVDGPRAPIGRPVANTTIYILDERLQPVPIGVPGELHTGGEGLARGYLNRPELTEERFVPNPFSDRPGARLYKTGDVCRYLRDGSIEFLGRADHQVKIRGFRVELGEIESNLCAHPDVLQAVVIVREDNPGDKRLVSYFVPVDTALPPSAAALRDYLREKLPDYMVPSAIVCLGRFPLNGSGKIDRKALPAPDLLPQATPNRFVPPRTPVEEVLVEIWAEVLRVDQVGVHDNFFELGGHSLMASQVVARVQRLLGAEVPLPAIFEHPTVAGLAAEIARLPGEEVSASPTLIRADRGQNPALSFAQQRLWFLDRFESSGSAYNVPSAWRLQGDLNRPALEQAINAIVARHESLRTRFADGESGPVQIIETAACVSLQVEELGGREGPVKDEAVRQAVLREFGEPFDLAKSPLLRAKLLVLGGKEHLLLLTCHHIASDGWSLGVLNRELAAFYAAFRQNREPNLPELPVQYADYAVWQRAWLHGLVIDRQMNYWRRQLSSCAALELPTDHPRPTRKTHAGACHAFVLPAGLSSKLAAFNRSASVTPFMSLLGTFQVLLARHSGQRDILVGTPIANRQHRKLEDLIGFFVNTLVMRADLSGDLSFHEVVSKARKSALEAYQHQDLPFEKLVEELKPARDPGRHPLFQVLFAVQNAPSSPFQLGGLEVSTIALPAVSTRFDLELHLQASGNTWEGLIYYSTDLFNQDTIVRLAGHYLTLLESMLAEPAQPVWKAAMLTPPERERILVEWNNTAADYPREKCIHEIFEEQAAKTPEAVAVVFKNNSLTYLELDERSNRLAHHLRRRGVTRNTLVGLGFERSTDMVVAMLGVLKAGGAYLNVDPEFPADRIDFMTRDSGVAHLVTVRALRSLFPVEIPCCVLLDDDASALAAEPRTAVESRGLPADLAYCIYTSGSTGKPKGVLIEHGNVVRLVRNLRIPFQFNENDVWTMFHSYCFDFSVWEMYGALMYGGRLVMVSKDTARNTAAFLGLLVAERVTVLNQVPTAFYALTAEVFKRSDAALALRYVVFGGEALQPVRLREWRKAFPRVRMINMYGITETTVHSSFREVTDEDVRDNTSNIGRPIPNTTLFLLDQELQLLPAGVMGEIFVGGECLARNYLNRPELTAERFIPHPFATEPGERLYRSGDLGRHRADGSIEFLGRLDHQVKIRGYRVELGEIESALNRSPGVREAVVSLREAGAGGSQLVAYLVLMPGEKLDPASFRARLGRELAPYMVPAVFVPLEKLPLTPTGKVDRKALPAPDLLAQATSSPFVAPRTPVEEALTGVWAEVLRLDQVGVHDNFFELGGHSLMAGQVVARVQRLLGAEVLLPAIFEHPTVAGLAAEIARLRGEEVSAPPTLIRSDRGQNPPLSFAQQRLWFLDRFENSGSAYNVPSAWRLQGDLNRPALEQAINAIVARHESLRTRFADGEAGPVQIIEPAAHVSLPVEELGGREGPVKDEAVRQAVLRELGEPFDLAKSPLLRAKLLVLGGKEHLLLLTCHHITSDGWSLGVLNRELAAFYAAFRQNREPKLLELLVQYADYSVWQRKWLIGNALDRQMNYWRRQLSSCAALELPTDHPRPTRKTHAGACHAFVLPAGLSSKLAAFNRSANVTPFMSLLGAFQVLLARHSGQRDILVGTPIANRQRQELEDLIGFFVNTLVMRADLSGDLGFREVVTKARKSALEAYQHQDLPFEKLVEELKPIRDPSRHPLFQVMFAVQNAPSGPLELDGLEVSMPVLPTAVTRFDLELHLQAMGKTWEGLIYYSTDLFDQGTIVRLADHYLTLLESMLGDPDQPVWNAAMLAPDERVKILVEWNNTETDYPRDKGVHELFEEQAQKTPEAVAVVFGGEQWSYQWLNRRANQLVWRLRALGAGRGALVGICAERGGDMVAAVLATLKAGAACVPLDPGYPPSRLARMLEDAKLGLLLAHSSLLSRLPEIHGHTLSLDDQGPCREEAGNPPPWNCAEDLAYVMFTSGSTGRPKGVQVPHKTLQNLVSWQCKSSSAGPCDRSLQFASLNFDVSFQEIFATLASGGTLVVAPETARRDPTILSRLILEKDVSRIFLPFVALDALAREFAASDEFPRGLREVITAGEQLRITPAIATLFENLVGAVLVNQYGPTETHVATSFALTGPPGSWSALPPIGRPIANTRIYLLDPARQLVPIGAHGEVFIAGDGLARGYLERPDLTDERFVLSPFRPGERLYRTGDLARIQPNGQIEFLGRMDYQVKIRGFRVELGEIEAALAAHPDVRETVVSVRENEPGEKRLVAYVVPVDGMLMLDPAEVRGFLKQRLPDYMVPTTFVQLEKLPLSPNGKVDRKALPTPQLLPQATSTRLAAPRTPVEEALTGIWAEVLGLDQVGVRDNFFELGGHSLMAGQVVARIRRLLGAEVPLPVIFEHATVAALAGQIAALQGLELPAIPPLSRSNRGQSPPLSFAQQRFWFMDRFEESGYGYNLASAWRLQGDLNRPALEQAINAIVARHESLRTRFADGEAGPVQIIEPAARVSLPVEELGGREGTQKEDAIRNAFLRESGEPFDLARGPLLRARLLALGEKEHLLLVTCHHITSDGWSLGVFNRELAAFYAAFRQNREPNLPDLPVQYADYAVWQRAWLHGLVIDRQMNYWRRQLSSCAPLELPTDHARPTRKTHAGACHSFVLPAELSLRLAAFNRSSNVTPFMSLLGTFQVLLARHSGQRDILVGTPIANRQRRELEDLIGFFVNTLVMRGDLSGEPSFQDVVAKVRKSALEAYQHQDLPFEKLVEELKPARDPSRHPLFQVIFAVQNAPSSPFQLEGLEVSTPALPTAVTRFDLELHLQAVGKTWEGFIYYSTDLFEKETIVRLAGHYLTLLDSMLAEPDRPVWNAAMLTPAERDQILVEWNNTEAEYPRDKCVHELFEEQAQKTPEAVAVVFGGDHWTYRRLNERADALSSRLIEIGVRPDVLVGISAERSAEMIVGMLAILKAGGAYVPIDPTQPAERISFLLEDAAPQVLLAQRRYLSALPSSEARVVALEADFPRLETRIPTQQPGPDNLAYVMYTSGSTGRPKGVCVPHRGITRLVKNTNYAHFGPGETFLQLAPQAFDASTFEIWGALLNGAKLVVPPPVQPALSELGQWIKHDKITTLWLTAGLFHQMVEEQVESLQGLSQLLAGGDVLSPAHLRTALTCLPKCRIINGYGPTENTTFTCCHPIDEAEVKGARVSIGRPVANTTVYILDQHLQPVPIGVPGELHTGGEGLARGYLNRPELTEERFVPNPFSDRPGARLYKTGDVCRYLRDGSIEFLGRADRQVKIRGFRVELGEIEASLCAHPDVLQAVVIVREDNPGDKRLVSYLVPVDTLATLSVTELRGFLKQSLPDYMVPSAFVCLERFPLNGSGKIDRKALPAPGLSPGADETVRVEPRNETERQLAVIWADILGVPQVGLHDNFFDLGGHSLLLLRLQAVLEKTFRAAIPMEVIFGNPTVAELAVVVRATGAPGRPALAPVAPAGTSKPPLFFLHFLVVARRLEKHFQTERKVCAVCGPIEEALQEWRETGRVRLTIEDLAACDIEIIRKLQPSGPYNLAGYCFGGMVAFEAACQLRAQGEEVASLTLIDAFYSPGCAPTRFPRITRLLDWIGHLSKKNPGYILHQFKKRIALARSRWSDAVQSPNHLPKMMGLLGRVHNALRDSNEIERFQGAMVEAYRAKPFDGSAVLFRGVARRVSWAWEPGMANGWDQVVAHGVRVEDLPCNHSEIYEEPHLGAIAGRIKNQLGQLDAIRKSAWPTEARFAPGKQDACLR